MEILNDWVLVLGEMAPEGEQFIIKISNKSKMRVSWQAFKVLQNGGPMASS